MIDRPADMVRFYHLLNQLDAYIGGLQALRIPRRDGQLGRGDQLFLDVNNERCILAAIQGLCKLMLMHL